MQSWEEFVAEVERGEASKQDEGGAYNLGEGILRGLHERIARLEPETAQEAPPVPAEDLVPGQGQPQG